MWPSFRPCEGVGEQPRRFGSPLDGLVQPVTGDFPRVAYSSPYSRLTTRMSRRSGSSSIMASTSARGLGSTGQLSALAALSATRAANALAECRLRMSILSSVSYRVCPQPRPVNFPRGLPMYDVQSPSSR